MEFRVNGVRNLIETKARSTGRKLYSTFFDRPEYSAPLFIPSENTELLAPEIDDEGYWVGGPSPFYDEKSDEVYLYYRLRDPYRRGWKAVIARLEDENLEEVTSFYSEEFSAHSLEGGALHRENGEYVLYISYHEKSSGRWKIDRITADSIEGLEAENRKEVEIPSEKAHAKDPVIHDGELIVHTASKNFFKHSNLKIEIPDTEPEASEVGFRENTAEGRITGMLDLKGERFCFYDWLPSIIFTGEENARIGRIEDRKIEGLMEDRATASEHGTGSLRYVKPLKVEDEIWFFYEKSMPGKGHALCVHRVDTEEVEDRLEKLTGEKNVHGPSGI